MKRLLNLAVFTAACAAFVMAQSVKVTAVYNPPTLPGTHQDTVLNGLTSIRGCAVDLNAEGDGKAEIAVTDYSDNGHVCVFQVVGNDSIQLVWTSPKVTANGGGSTPRYVLFGDLDNDGKKEIIFQSQNNGIYIFEHDGIAGSHNYGTQPSQVINLSNLPGVSGNLEFMDIADVDGDGMPEILIAQNGASNAEDYYAIVSAVGDWSTDDPGFSSFTTEFQVVRSAVSTKYGLNGSPVAMIAANFGGTGKKQILIHNWNLKNVTTFVSTGTDAYVMADTTNNKQNVYLGGANDNVALFGGGAYDIDGDGRDEVYLPTYLQVTATPGIHMISYAAGDNLREIDSAKNVTFLDMSSVVSTSTFGFGYGDIDGNGKENIYTSSSYKANIISAEFQGGDKRNPANWVMSTIYAGDPTIYDSTGLTYRDSLGVLDTLRSIDPSFVSKFWAQGTDVDKDGLEDIVMPYQALYDSIRIKQLTWNVGGAKWDTIAYYRIANPKRWGLRILEKGGPTGVEAKDMTIILPEDFRLNQNYPNPFNPSTTISFYLPVRSRITLSVYDLLGREVRTLIRNEEREKGVGSAVWDGRDNRGFAVGSGTYFYTMRFGNFEKSAKMMLVK
jgi:hypothetical protein